MLLTIIRTLIIPVIFLPQLTIAASDPIDTDIFLAQSHQELAIVMDRISGLHQSARNSMRETLDLPLFTNYFSLPASQNNSYDEMGLLKISPEQTKIRKNIEDWVLSLHTQFPIGETCLIDRHGQEHMRVVGGRVEKPHLYSPEEQGSPFFSPTLALKAGEVHFSEPYMSADSFFWASSITSPIVLEDGTAPGFYHFELPIKVYSDLLIYKDFSFTQFSKNQDKEAFKGIFYILNKQGLIIASSKNPPNLNLPEERHPYHNDHLPDYLPPEKMEDYTQHFSNLYPGIDASPILNHIQGTMSGHFAFDLDGETFYFLYDHVPERPHWLIAYLVPFTKN